jgi:arginase
MVARIQGAGVRLFGVPLDLGAGRRGVDMGPSALRLAGLAETLRALGRSVEDAGNIPVPQRETLPEGNAHLRFLQPIAEVCRSLYSRTFETVMEGRVPLALGGDHSLAMGSIPGVADAAAEQGERVGVLWLDAHGDMNTAESSPTGNVHGMPLACVLGDGAKELTSIGRRTPAVDPQAVALIGIRAIDDAEARRIRDTGIHAYTMRDVDERGMKGVVQDALDTLLPRCDRLHVSFDVDFLDPSIAPGVGTRVRGGPTYRESHLVMEMLADTERVGSVDVVELNPILDRENDSALLAVELLASLFGKAIL